MPAARTNKNVNFSSKIQKTMHTNGNAVGSGDGAAREFATYACTDVELSNVIGLFVQKSRARFFFAHQYMGCFWTGPDIRVCRSPTKITNLQSYQSLRKEYKFCKLLQYVPAKFEKKSQL
jgi:hypothetical protein